MNKKEDSAWVFDSLVGFLQGPIWSAPLLSFIEEKSLIFEADIEDSAEYREVYQEYKNLVDLLLGCYMDDMEITPEQFEHACSLNKNTKMPIQFTQSLFEQIWAANEYEIFKRMMIQKNLELQLQALNLIEQKYGLTPESLTGETNVLRDELMMEQLLHKQILDEGTVNELEVDTDESFSEEHERLATKYQNERELLKKALQESANSPRSVSPESEKHISEEELKLESLPSTAEIAGKNTPSSLPESNRAPSSEPVAEKKKPTNTMEDEIEMRKRQNYLKAQRDKLVALKKQARSQRLETNTARPGSARVIAEAAIKGEQDLEAPQALESSKLQVRKALAARLKAEVVQK